MDTFDQALTDVVVRCYGTALYNDRSLSGGS
jgi:hypothetical protein